MIGETLAHFKITAKLGEGGMGEVYRAEDTKLGREVAIKVLPEEVANDTERLARFEREAKVLASLNHSNIAGIYSLEAAGLRAGRPGEESTMSFLVMELAPGEDLAERLSRGPIPADDAIPIVRQIAEALEAAHETGIIHRDLKPQNIKLTEDGQVKVLDFGLAKALDPTTEGSDSGSLSPNSPAVFSMSPTLTQGMTTAGVILGTAAYMSPEQAKGRAVDKRSDIWAFGVVLYEMLVGKKLFDTETLPETLGAIFQQEIDLEELPSSTPRSLRRLLERCLERDPKLRLRDIGEARIALDEMGSEDESTEETSGATVARRRISPALFAGALLLVAIGAALIGIRMSPAPEMEPPEVTEFSIWIEGLRGLAPSHDGNTLAWTDGSKIFLRDLANRTPREVLEQDGIRDLFWSPDGRYLAVEWDEQLWRLDLTTGDPEPICELPKLPNVPRASILRGQWREDDTILFAAWRGGIYTVPAKGGTPALLVPIDPEVDVDFHGIEILPDGHSLLLAAHYQEEGSGKSGLQSGTEIFRDGKRSAVDLPGQIQDMLPSSYFQGQLYMMKFGDRSSSMWTVPFDSELGQISGEPELFRSEIELGLIAGDGSFIYLAPRENPGIVIQADFAGTELRRIGEAQADLRAPALSPDGTRLAVVIGTELWVRDLERETMTRLVQEEQSVVDPQWTPDSRTLYYTEGNSGRFRRIRADPGAEAETVLEDGYRSFLASNGTGILVDKGSFRLDKQGGLFWYPLQTDGSLEEGRLIVDGFDVRGRLSPDGRLMAYSSGSVRPWESFLTTFPDSDQTIQLSSGGGGTPRWSADGKKVYYFSETALVEVEAGFDVSGRIRASPEKPLFVIEELGFQQGGWDVTPDGMGFLFIRSLETDDGSEVVVVRNALAARQE